MRFLEPETLNEALDALMADPDGTKVIAGGTALVLMMRNGLIAPPTLLSLGRVPDLDVIRQEGDTLIIGAMTPLREVANSPLARQHFPALADACGMVGNARVRNQATLGGNLAEADYASDPPAVLLALGACVNVVDSVGGRSVDIADLITGFYATTLDPRELITTITIPIPPPNTRMAYLKYKSRSSEDRPCVGVAAVATFDGEACADLRVAVGAACEIPRRLHSVEQMAKGQPLTDSLIAEIAEGYAAGIDTLEDMRGSTWYRQQMIRAHARRALEEVRDGRR